MPTLRLLELAHGPLSRVRRQSRTPIHRQLRLPEFLLERQQRYGGLSTTVYVLKALMKLSLPTTHRPQRQLPVPTRKTVTTERLPWQVTIRLLAPAFGNLSAGRQPSCWPPIATHKSLVYLPEHQQRFAGVSPMVPVPTPLMKLSLPTMHRRRLPMQVIRKSNSVTTAHSS